MIETLRTLLAKAYSIPERKLVWVNIVLAGFVALAHGGALALTFSAPTPDAAESQKLASISLPIVAVIFITAAAALLKSRLLSRVLALHGIVLSAGVSFLLLWALGVLFNGAPEGARFSWSVGFLSASACYASVLFCRFSVPPHMRSYWGVYYGPAIALACASLVDVSVFFRVVA